MTNNEHTTLPLFQGSSFIPPRDVARIWNGKDKHYDSGTTEPYDRVRCKKQLEMDGGPASDSIIDRAVTRYGPNGRLHRGLLPKFPILRDQHRPWLVPPLVLPDRSTVRVAWSVNLAGGLEEINDEFCTLMRYTRNEVEHHPAQPILRPRTPADDPELLQIADTMRRLRDPADALAEAHFSSWIEGNPLRDGPRIALPTVMMRWNGVRSRWDVFAEACVPDDQPDAVPFELIGKLRLLCDELEARVDNEGALLDHTRALLRLFDDVSGTASVAALLLGAVRVLDLLGDGRADNVIAWCRVLLAPASIHI